MSQKPIFICAVVGPTASGKTGLAIELAKRNNGEIVSFDSMQIYKNAPIATAVPTKEERQGIPHHLMEFVENDVTFSVGKFTELAHKTIRQIAERGKLPVLVGGTGLYFSSLLDNIRFQSQSNSHFEWRHHLESRLQNEGIDVLYQELQQIDVKAAEKIHKNNHVRVIRALEIFYATGKTLTQQEEESRCVPSPYNACVFGLNYRDRSRLYERINSRVHVMLEMGIVDEIKSLYQTNPKGTIMQAIGVKEFIPYFNGERSLDETVQTIQQESRRYAKRQLTWFRRDERVQWLYPDDYNIQNDLFDYADKLLKERISSDKEVE